MAELDYITLGEPGEAPYSDIVTVNGKMMFLSGMVSESYETGELLPGTITEETRQALTNLKTVLERYGSDMAHVVRVEVILSDFSERDEMNAEYVKHFPADRMPARVCFGGAALADGCKIEIMATAVKK